MTPLELTGTGSEPRGTAHRNDTVLDVVRVDKRRLLPDGVPQRGGGQPIHHLRDTVVVLEEQLCRRGAEQRAVDPGHPTMIRQMGAEFVLV